MPHSLRVYKALRASGYADQQAMCISEVLEQAKSNSSPYDRECILDCLCVGGTTEVLAEALCDCLQNCFSSQRFATHFDRTVLKTALVRAKMPATAAEPF